MPNVQIIYEKIALFMDFVISSLQFIIIFFAILRHNCLFLLGTPEEIRQPARQFALFDFRRHFLRQNRLTQRTLQAVLTRAETYADIELRLPRPSR